MIARDELKKVIVGYFGPTLKINAYKTPEQQDDELTDAIIAAGYSKPRTINTVEELDALGKTATILDRNGHVWTNDGDSEDEWGSVTDPETYGGPKWVGSADIARPVTVLHEPTA